MKQVVGQFLKMYSTPVFPWKSLQETVNYLGLTPATSSSGLVSENLESLYGVETENNYGIASNFFYLVF